MKLMSRIAVAISMVAAMPWYTAPAVAQTPDLTKSYYTPQAGDNLTPLEGNDALPYLRVCPNNDGGASLPLNARIMIHLEDGNGPMSVAASDIFMLFNGGTPAQGFTAATNGFGLAGADSIIANSLYNPAASCPDVRAIYADQGTDASGNTWITFTGVGGVRDPSRKWGAYEGDIPVYVRGVPLDGRLTPSSTNGDWKLHFHNFDSVGGRTTAINQGEMINSLDINPVSSAMGSGVYQFSLDFDNDGSVYLPDYNMIFWHNGHKCDSPLP
jgi:hypothetical protein